MNVPSRLDQKKLWIIAPAFNEQESLPRFVEVTQQACAALENRYEVTVILVNDGSSDGTPRVLRELVDSRRSGPFKVIGLHLSRNFGHQGAINAGLRLAFDRSTPESFFVVMDSDLQHPPRCIPQIIEGLEAGKDHVRMIRQETDEAGSPLSKTLSSRAFYWLFRKLSGVPLMPGSADFRGMKHAVVKAYLDLPETDRFNRGLFLWVGFEQADVPYQVAARHAGVSKYSWKRMIRLAVTGITSFSSKPLMLSLMLTVGSSFLFCVLYLAYQIHSYFILHRAFSIGWPSLVFLITFWGGVLSVNQLLLSLYVSKIYVEVKRRPGYITRLISE